MFGRIDYYKKWDGIKNSWVEAYRNREDISGLSCKKYVSHDDEWCAEAYMETNYEDLTEKDFEKAIKNYLVFKLLNNVE